MRPGNLILLYLPLGRQTIPFISMKLVYLFAMQALPNLFHHLRMSKSFFSCRSLGLSNSEFFKKLYPCFESFIMLNAHDNKIAHTIIRGKINRLVLLMAQISAEGRHRGRPLQPAQGRRARNDKSLPSTYLITVQPPRH